MIIDREGIVRHWAKSPKVEPVPEGYIRLDFGHVCFPEPGSLSPKEKELLRPVLERNPDILRYEIWCEKRVQ